MRWLGLSAGGAVMSAHTQGLWSVEGSTRIIAGAPHALGGHPVVICDASDCCDRMSFDEAKANARLIAAAPELLAALRPIAAYPDDPGTSDLDDAQPVTITLGDVRRAWRAIAKAAAQLHAGVAASRGTECAG